MAKSKKAPAKAATKKPAPKSPTGAADILLTLSEGTLTVRHTDKFGEVLHKRRATTADWDKIWKAIKG